MNIRVLSFLASMLVAAGVLAQPAAQTLTPVQKADVRRIIEAWLECEECTEGQLNAVVRLGQVAVPTLSATLSGGPSVAKRSELGQHLLETYRKLKEYERKHPEARVSMTEDE